MIDNSATYWQSRYEAGNHPWDAGSPTRPLAEYIDTLTDRSLRILVPGGGFGHELAYLLSKGFADSYLLDFAPSAIAQVRQAHPELDPKHLLCEDFFAHSTPYDLILEQTFFCALPPDMRPRYAEHMKRLLRPGGRLAGVMFSFPLTEEGPPYGGSEEEYRGYFEPLFSHVHFEPCTNSIPPRMGRELWVELTR